MSYISKSIKCEAEQSHNTIDMENHNKFMKNPQSFDVWHWWARDDPRQLLMNRMLKLEKFQLAIAPYIMVLLL